MYKYLFVCLCVSIRDLWMNQFVLFTTNKFKWLSQTHTYTNIVYMNEERGIVSVP